MVGDRVTVYTEEWHAWHAEKYNEWSTRALFGVFAHLGVPKRMLDVGCADGHLVKMTAKLCDYAAGVDIAVHGEAGLFYDLFQQDLSRPLVGVSPYYDLVISWEVAEHIAPESADTFVDSLARHVGEDGHLVFTAAIPGQGGLAHVNEQPHGYWREKLEARGLTCQSDLTEALRATWQKTTGDAWWYPQNVQVFKR